MSCCEQRKLACLCFWDKHVINALVDLRDNASLDETESPDRTDCQVKMRTQVEVDSLGQNEM